MADLSITVASVVAGASATQRNGIAAVTVTAGQVVYLDSATNTLKLADNDSATAAARSPYGIALHGALAGQPLAVLTQGAITIGATLIAGAVYILSSTAGGIAPSADFGSGDYNTIIGIANSTTVLDVKFHESGVVAV